MVGLVYTTLEEFENGVHSENRSNTCSFHLHHAERVLKHNNHRSFGFLFEENSDRKITWNQLS